MRKVKLAVARYLFFLAIQLRIYATWSKIHRALFDRAARNTPLPTFKSLDDMLPHVRGFVWRQDSWIDLGDAICSPEMVWYRYLNSVDHKVGDCDEFAVFESSVIQKSIDDHVWESEIEDPDIVTVTWMDKRGAVAGHNVCLIRIGPCYGYMDYDMPRWCGGKLQVVNAVLKRYAPEADLVGWAVHSPGLKKREVHV